MDKQNLSAKSGCFHVHLDLVKKGWLPLLPGNNQMQVKCQGTDSTYTKSM